MTPANKDWVYNDHYVGAIMVSINDENRTRQGSNADQQCFLSVDHEHVLVYGNEGFCFNGFEKSYEMFGNADNDPRGDWRTSDLTLGFS